MKIEKVFNNNVVQVRSDKDEELIVMGRGLGFQKKAGDRIDADKVEKTFVLEAFAKDELSQLYQNIPAEEAELVMMIIRHAEEVLQTTFEESFYLSLLDHVHFTLERHAQNLPIQNPLSWEIRKFYPIEYQLGKDALRMIFENLQILLPDDEASSIALHFINAQKDKGLYTKSHQVAKLVSDILGIVRLYYGAVQDETSLSYSRFATHVQYFAQRVLNGLVQGQNDSFLFEQVKLNYPEAFACTERIKNYVEANYDFDMSLDEQVYLTIHLARLDVSRLR